MSQSEQPVSFADQIRNTVRTKEPVDRALKTSQRMLARITDGIYRQPASAFRELISNAYDADATEVVIFTDAPRFHQVTVKDNGIGISPDLLEHIIDHIGGSTKRTNEGIKYETTSEEDTSKSKGGRQLIGKLGIGLFAVVQLTRHFLIITKKKGDKFKTVADITLVGPDEEKQQHDSTTDHEDINKGHARVWQEPAEAVESQGTEIRLLDLLPRTRQDLASTDRWTKYDFEMEEYGKPSTPPPTFHAGRMESQSGTELSLQPNLPWTESDSKTVRFQKLVQEIRSHAKTEKELVDLEIVCDRYLQTIWTVALSSPLNYVEDHPFNLSPSSDLEAFELENSLRGQAKEVDSPPDVSLRKHLRLKSPYLPSGDKFKVIIDGVQLFRPIVFRNQPKTRNAIKQSLIFIGKCREPFDNRPYSLSGGVLDFEAYLFWTPKVIPKQHAGVMLRVGNASGTPFDPTFMGYQVSEQTRLRQITAEIFVRQGLDGAINLDRETFNYSHPHYQFLTKWLHSALRQLTNRQKGIGNKIRTAKKADQGKKAVDALETLVEKRLLESGIEDVPQVQLLEPLEGIEAPSLREQGILALRREVVLPDRNGKKSGNKNGDEDFKSRKLIAIAQILHGWGLLDGLTFQDQERLIRDILEIALAGVEQ